ncbi:hypothetical protein ACHELS_002489 [Vibrio vulnificus]|uniref:hypothetical protein n=2 Tax=Vibrio vulnificus TaxID=672 RepID=UPI000C7A60F4|nr:hypothetical protein [Vibrio vulnificus]AUJ34374.1 hypothetical protein BWZ32_05430 [Vibrio vulnificus]EGR0081300.1 hypothetical protein [Vibrio vulnificus]ELK8509171.1 hypothetical protein [Vibrio vulnificus]ELK8995649.1 hypothetical protein [Vibrio vulnificus]ELK8997956.1 hypothetical protein [Vibrio vulnificus]
MNKNLISLSILSLLLLSGCNGSSNSSSPIPEKQTRSELDFKTSKFSPKSEQWLSYEEKKNHYLDGNSSEALYIQYVAKTAIELIDTISELPQDETKQLTGIINNLSNHGIENFYIRVVKNSMGSREDIDFLYEKSGQLYRINEKVALSLIDFFNEAPSLIHIFDDIEFPTSADTYNDQQIGSSFFEHDVRGLHISNDDAYRLLEQYDMDNQNALSDCSLNWKREQKKVENGKMYEKVNNKNVEIGLLEYRSRLALQCSNGSQPSSNILIDDTIMTIYHPTFGHIIHTNANSLGGTTLTLQDLKWVSQ